MGEPVTNLPRHSLLICAVFIATTLLTACGEQLSCSAPETQQIVKQIASDDAKNAGLLTPGQPSISYSLGSIVTIEKGTTKAACKAVLTITFSVKGPPERSHSSDINLTYNAEKTDDGRLYVTVYGL